MKQESAKPYSAKQESAKTGIRNLLNLDVHMCSVLAGSGLAEYGLADSGSRFRFFDLVDSCLAKYGLADSCFLFYPIPV